MLTTTLSESRKTQYLEDLKTLLRIPSVSTDPERKHEVRRCAGEVARQMKDAGLQGVEIMDTPGHPVVYGEYMVSEKVPTALVYGHYDVQPEDPIELWTSPPFEPTIRDGKIFARGSTDDKGQFLCHVKAVAAMLEEDGTLPVNVKFIIEGEEEIGSPNLAPFLKANKEKLKADVLVVSDSAMYAPDQPSLVYGLRGLCYLQIDLKGADSDLHSGVFGGAVPNPALELARILAQLKDADEKITVPGFYDKVQDMSPEERQAYATLEFSADDFKNSVGVAELTPEKGYSALEGRTARPTLEVNGLLSGYTGEGAKTVLPGKAMAKVSCRLVPDQDPEEIAQLLEDHIRRLCPSSMVCKVTQMHGGHPWLTPPDHPALEAAAIAIRNVFNKEPVRIREGGSIPIVIDFQKILDLPGILLGFGLNDENLHAPDEHFRVENFYKGIEISRALFNALAARKAEV
jgi:acetylornithine deacetylase/succinyl-diaminopimelate desuccinylase-like protein